MFELSQEAMDRMIRRLVDNAKDTIEDVNNNKNDELYEGKKRRITRCLITKKMTLK